jgi:prepilin-type N-terminal cleavage/methylation domain-containing protein/prepilin-type processing-associated H-X9-DG protein
MKSERSKGGGFTLIELLVVIVIIAVLTALVTSFFQKAVVAGRRAACVSNLRQIGIGIGAYAADNDGQIPYGPKAPPFMNPLDFYPSTGAPTSLISLQSGAPIGLGLLLDKYLSKTPKVFFCPGADQPLDADKELAKVGKSQAQSSYYYRHGGNTNLFDVNGKAPPTPPIRLGALGNNSHGDPIRALVMDTEFLAKADYASFGISTKTNHQHLWCNVLFVDGHVNQLSNRTGLFTVDETNYSDLDAAFSKIMAVFETADTMP